MWLTPATGNVLGAGVWVAALIELFGADVLLTL
jgi:hypothetical protein